MAITNNTPLKITENLLKLERGNNELLLANYLDLQPLYIKKGRRYINEFLKAVSDLGTYKKIIETFPQETNLLDTLLDHGIIVPHVLSTHKPKKHSSGDLDLENQRSMSLYLLISQSCNMGCVYCLNGKKTYQPDKNLMMSQETAFKAIDRCFESLVHQGYLEIIFFGGEPLLNWPLAKKIIIYCENSLKGKHSGKRVIYHFTSNLSFLPNDLIEWAKKYNISFLCDIDGPDKIHNRCRPFIDGRPSHDIIATNVTKLIKADLKVDLRATVTAMNQDYLLEVTEHHKSLGAKSSAFIPVNPINSDEDILAASLLPSAPKIIRSVTKVYLSKVWDQEQLFPFNHYASRLAPGDGTVFGCGAPYGNTAIVDVNGDVYPCIYLVGIKRYHLGNITNESYPNRNLLYWMRDYLHVDHLEDCKSCPWRYICGGGCPLGRLTVLNNPLATPKVLTYCKKITCDYTKKIMEILMWEKAQETAANLMGNFKMSEAIGVGPIIHCS
jgi:uncharacterized protein